MSNQPTTNIPRLPRRPLGRVFAIVAVSTLAFLVIPTYASAARVNTNLIGFWPIDESVGNKINDTVGTVRAKMIIYKNNGGNGFNWLPVEGALQITSNDTDTGPNIAISSSISSSAAATTTEKIRNAAMAANAFSAEVWFSPSTVNTNSDPQIIFSYGCHDTTADGNCTRGANILGEAAYVSNFFIAQYNADLVVGFRRSNNLGIGTTNAIPIDQSIQLPGILQTNVLTHVVLTWDGATKRITAQRINATSPDSSFGTEPGETIFNYWLQYPIGVADPEILLYANDLGQFNGKVYLAAVYSRALTSAEIGLNFLAACGDTDGDGFGNSNSFRCTGGKWGLDCKTAEDTVYPGAPNICDDFDNNCDGITYEGCDDDDDNYCDSAKTMGSSGASTCTGTLAGGQGNDCDDTVTTGFPINPGVTEICDEIDNDCAGDIVATPINEGIDDGCDDDGDKYCDAGMVKQVGMSVNACPNTASPDPIGDDCDDRLNGADGTSNTADDGINIHPPPITEICDNVKNNCDLATVDEGCDDDDDNYCDYTYIKAAGVTVTTCSATLPAAVVGDDCNDNPAACGAACKPGGTEICDGWNNDCDAQTDEGLAGLACPVAGQQGECAIGSSTCAGGVGGCTQTVSPVAETCDGKDNDCANGIDDGNPGSGAACAVSGKQGECAKGTSTCTAGNLECPQTIFPVAEICNNLDDDCNNTIDNGVTRSCYTGPGGTQGFGICTSGNETCTTGTWGACAGEILPQAEVCDALSLDENCNKSSNEICVCVPNATQPCYTGTPATRGEGICRDGTQTCNATGTAWSTCAGQVLPQTEACNNQGTDDDCDSNSNELTNGINVGATCTAPLPARGVCAANGTQACSNNTATGTVVCNAPAPGTESCGNQTTDDDCDGNPNELTDGIYRDSFCPTGLFGICEPGMWVCSNATATGVLQCQQTNAQGTESCSNIGTDDNCDGTDDENVGAEFCDGQDNNCQNGLSDDGSADPQIKNRETCTPCACGTCVWQCSAIDRKQCVSITGSSREQCNGKDDNCNGIKDEGCELYANRTGNITIGGIPLRYCPFAPK